MSGTGVSSVCSESHGRDARATTDSRHLPAETMPHGILLLPQNRHGSPAGRRAGKTAGIQRPQLEAQKDRFHRQPARRRRPPDTRGIIPANLLSLGADLPLAVENSQRMGDEGLGSSPKLAREPRALRRPNSMAASVDAQTDAGPPGPRNDAPVIAPEATPLPSFGRELVGHDGKPGGDGHQANGESSNGKHNHAKVRCSHTTPGAERKRRARLCFSAFRSSSDFTAREHGIWPKAKAEMALRSGVAFQSASGSPHQSNLACPTTVLRRSGGFQRPGISVDVVV